MTNTVWTIPGSEADPVFIVEGEIITYGVVFEGKPSAVTSVTVYKDGSDTDYSGTAMPTGGNSISGKTVVWKALNGISGDGGSYYIVATKAVVDGNTEVRKTFFRVVSDEGKS